MKRRDERLDRIHGDSVKHSLQLAWARRKTARRGTKERPQLHGERLPEENSGAVSSYLAKIFLLQK